jgi:hypothetical protein
VSWDGLHLERVDPVAWIASSIEPRARRSGSLAYFATDIAEPGVHSSAPKAIASRLVNPMAGKSERAKAIAEALMPLASVAR